jgi:molybdate transport system regulatory protein
MFRMNPRIKLYLSTESAEGVFGGGKWRLLNAVKEHGSLQQAAASLGRSYRKAWGDIKKAEEGLGRKLVIKSRGGKSGGATTLTCFAAGLLDAWDDHYREVATCMEKSYRIHVLPLFERTGTAINSPDVQRNPL